MDYEKSFSSWEVLVSDDVLQDLDNFAFSLLFEYSSHPFEGYLLSRLNTILVEIFEYYPDIISPSGRSAVYSTGRLLRSPASDIR